MARLEAKDWVQRTPDPTDGRFTLATLTEDGWTPPSKAAP
ncbi:hypothetical protein [Streptomyces anulatus]